MIELSNHELITNANHAIARVVAMRPRRRGGTNIRRPVGSGEKCPAQCVSSLAAAPRRKLWRLAEAPRNRRREPIG
jgi:hypothetical protein